MLFRCCLTIITLRHISHLVYFCPFLGLGLFMSYVCDLFFIFSIFIIVINHMTSFKQTYLFFVNFLEYLLLLLDNEDEQGFIQAILMSCRQHKILNLLIEFSNSIFIKICFKAYWCGTCIQNKLAYKVSSILSYLFVLQM